MIKITVKMYSGITHELTATDDQLFGMLQTWGSGDGLLMVPLNTYDMHTPIGKVTRRRWIHPRDVSEISC